MSDPLHITKVAMMVHVSDLDAAFEWYTRLFGREPDRAFFPNFKEWQVTDTCWLQVAEGEVVPGGSAISFSVEDIEATRHHLQQTLRVEISEVERVPGVAAWCDFRDPFGNRWGLYQHLQSPREESQPGATKG
jgi:predicted enzyme related to lactoylglutathione lyase